MNPEHPPHHLEPGIQNRSEPKSGSQSVGRPAVLDDAALNQLAVDLWRQSGRVPRINDIIDAAGGAQRARATRARRHAAAMAADAKAREWINVAPAFESTVRALLGQFLELARNEAADRISETLLAADNRIADAQEVAAHATHRIRSLEAKIEELSTELDSSRSALKRSDVGLHRTRSELRRVRAQAKERQRALDIIAGHGHDRDSAPC